jgi:hypothetical protein
MDHELLSFAIDESWTYDYAIPEPQPALLTTSGADAIKL